MLPSPLLLLPSQRCTLFPLLQDVPTLQQRVRRPLLHVEGRGLWPHAKQGGRVWRLSIHGCWRCPPAPPTNCNAQCNLFILATIPFPARYRCVPSQPCVTTPNALMPPTLHLSLHCVDCILRAPHISKPSQPCFCRYIPACTYPQTHANHTVGTPAEEAGNHTHISIPCLRGRRLTSSAAQPAPAIHTQGMLCTSLLAPPRAG